MDIDAILEEVWEMSGRAPPREDEFTLKDYTTKFGVSEWVARRALKKLIESGFLARRKAYQDGHIVMAYRKTGE